jgi:hypothetical protein
MIYHLYFLHRQLQVTTAHEFSYMSTRNGDNSTGEQVTPDNSFPKQSANLVEPYKS